MKHYIQGGAVALWVVANITLDATGFKVLLSMLSVLTWAGISCYAGWVFGTHAFTCIQLLRGKVQMHIVTHDIIKIEKLTWISKEEADTIIKKLRDMQK